MVMATRTEIDFHAVDQRHVGIHERLLNWGRWCNGSGGPDTSPMFRLFVSTAKARAGHVTASTVVPVDRTDAILISKAVIALPAPHRAAVNWAYIRPVSPRRAAANIGTTLDGLAQLLRDGRTILINRRV